MHSSRLSYYSNPVSSRSSICLQRLTSPDSATLAPPAVSRNQHRRHALWCSKAKLKECGEKLVHTTTANLDHCHKDSNRRATRKWTKTVSTVPASSLHECIVTYIVQTPTRRHRVAGTPYLAIYLPQRLSGSHLAGILRYFLLDRCKSITLHACIVPGKSSRLAHAYAPSGTRPARLWCCTMAMILQRG
jgi:hypothetical protein